LPEVLKHHVKTLLDNDIESYEDLVDTFKEMMAENGEEEIRTFCDDIGLQEAADAFIDFAKSLPVDLERRRLGLHPDSHVADIGLMISCFLLLAFMFYHFFIAKRFSPQRQESRRESHGSRRSVYDMV